MNIASNTGESQDFTDFLETCPAEDEISMALWFFEHGESLPNVSPNAMRRLEIGNGTKRVHLILTLLRTIEADEPVGVHVSIPSKGAPPHCFFLGASTNVFGEPSEGVKQFFVEPGTDLSFQLHNVPMYVNQDFTDGSCPPLVPQRTTVWTRQPYGAPLRRANLLKWEFGGVAA